MPLQATSGAASYDAFGGGAPYIPQYIEDVFSTFLYTGNGGTQTITNGIDLAGKGGLTWFKARDVAAGHLLFDSARGVTKYLISNLTNAEATSGAGERLTAYNSNGFSLGTDPGSAINASSNTYASWTFRKQPKFYTQELISHTNGTATNIDLSTLGTVGYLHAKITNTTGDWIAWHRSLTAGNNLRLNTMAAQSTTSAWLSVSGTTATLSASAPTGSYIIHAFAHDAGGFGLTGTDNVISCGSFVGTGAEQEINLGYEPQLVIRKAASTTSNWTIFDNMRGFSQTNTAYLYPNLSNAESNYTGSDNDKPTATGFRTTVGSGQTWIYIAIRRGPMKTPTSGTSVYGSTLVNGGQWDGRYGIEGSQAVTGQGADLIVDFASRATPTNPAWLWSDRLRGFPVAGFPILNSSSTAAEVARTTNPYRYRDEQYYYLSTLSGMLTSFFRRAPGFFDVVCYTATGSAGTVAHNLAAVPELMIVKRRDTTAGWIVYSSALGATKYLVLHGTNAEITESTIWNDTAPTSSVFTVGTAASVNSNTRTYVAYLFASCPGVSKVGSYTGTGTTQVIDCGFTAGSRFVMIKRTDSTGDWYVWDSARGIVSGNDPYLLLNSTAAEVTNTDYIDTASTGFEISSTAPADINASGGTYIFLAIA